MLANNPLIQNNAEIQCVIIGYVSGILAADRSITFHLQCIGYHVKY